MADNKNAKSKRAAGKAPTAVQAPPSGEFLALWQEARRLEDQLEIELLDDAVKTARMALEELHAETKTQPFERRRGLRLREKSQRVERAFNRLRALRKGELLPERHPDD